MKVKFWIYIENLGDGSAAARFFSIEALAERYASHDNERFCDDIYPKELEFDENGKLLTPDPVHYNQKFDQGIVHFAKEVDVETDKESDRSRIEFACDKSINSFKEGNNQFTDYADVFVAFDGRFFSFEGPSVTCESCKTVANIEEE